MLPFIEKSIQQTATYSAPCLRLNGYAAGLYLLYTFVISLEQTLTYENKFMGLRDDPVGKGTCCQYLRPEFDPWKPHAEREPTLENLLSGLHMHTLAHVPPS